MLKRTAHLHRGPTRIEYIVPATSSYMRLSIRMPPPHLSRRDVYILRRAGGARPMPFPLPCPPYPFANPYHTFLLRSVQPASPHSRQCTPSRARSTPEPTVKVVGAEALAQARWWSFGARTVGGETGNGRGESNWPRPYVQRGPRPDVSSPACERVYDRHAARSAWGQVGRMRVTPDPQACVSPPLPPQRRVQGKAAGEPSALPCVWGWVPGKGT